MAFSPCITRFWNCSMLNWLGTVTANNKVNGKLTNYQSSSASFTIENHLQIDWSFRDYLLPSVFYMKQPINSGSRQITYLFSRIYKVIFTSEITGVGTLNAAFTLSSHAQLIRYSTIRKLDLQKLTNHQSIMVNQLQIDRYFRAYLLISVDCFHIKI